MVESEDIFQRNFSLKSLKIVSGIVPLYFVPEVSLVLVYFFTLNHELSRITPSASPVAMISFVFTFFALIRILCSFRNYFRAVKDYRFIDYTLYSLQSNYTDTPPLKSGFFAKNSWRFRGIGISILISPMPCVPIGLMARTSKKYREPIIVDKILGLLRTACNALEFTRDLT